MRLHLAPSGNKSNKKLAAQMKQVWTSRNRSFLIGLARASGGAILFALPMLMTMEMWWLGFYMHPLRLGLLIVLAVPLLTGLAFYSGFEKRVSLKGAVVDAFVGYAVGFVCSALVLTLMHVIDWSMSIDELIGKITLQAIPGGLGAVLAASQLSLSEDEVDAERDRPCVNAIQGYLRELFLMLAGGLFLAFNVAPTEEIVVIAYKMTAWHAIVLLSVSMLVMHAFVYVVKFRGQEEKPEEDSWWRVLLRFTVVGYGLALLVSFYCLWTFGRTDDTDVGQSLVMAVVLSFPASLGAAAARLIL